MALTNADPVPMRKGGIGRKTGVVLIVFCVFLGLLSFFFCLVAESTRSQLIQEVRDGTGGGKPECTFTNNGKTPSICATCALLSLAIVMMLLYRPLLSYLSISGVDRPGLFMTNEDVHNNPNTSKASLLFYVVWFLFMSAELMLLEGRDYETDHITWLTSEDTSEAGYYCVVTRKGVFVVAGIIGIAMVFLASRLSLTALEAEWLLQDQEIVRQEAVEASIL